MTRARKTGLLAIIGPGILVAATGVGAGDLATGALTGSKLGVAVLWAAVLGAALKYLLTEGLARWQLATGETFLEGSVKHFGPVVQYAFLAYLVAWSIFVGSALMSACGVASHAILPLARFFPAFDADADKIVYGLLHSATAVVLVRLGGFRLFERVMSVAIGLMFATVMATACALLPAWGELARGIFWPTVPDFQGDGIGWTVALIGGVGGTVTILCYGYWIREEGRAGTEDLRTCRIDLATGYVMTALFGMGMVILGSRITPDPTKSPATLIVDLADQLESALGPLGTAGRWAFLLGAWGAIASSLLGVWQSVPYLFADFWRMTRGVPNDAAVDTNSRPYRMFLYGIAVVPMAGLWFNFEYVQKVYAIVGALFLPMLAVALMVLNGRSRWIGAEHRNSVLTTVLLAGTVLFFAVFGWFVVMHGYPD